MSSYVEGKRIYFYGTLAGMTLRQADSLVGTLGASVARSLDDSVNLVVIGEAKLLGRDWVDMMERCNDFTRAAFESGKLDILAESDFWQRLPLNDSDQPADNVARSELPPPFERPLYTPSMLAELLGQPIASVRLWFRRGMLIPAKQIGRLPYFPPQEVLVARRIADFQAVGMSLDSIVRHVRRWSQARPGARRIILDLIASPAGDELLLRTGGMLIDLDGQIRIDFEQADVTSESRQECDQIPEVNDITNGNVSLKQSETNLDSDSTSGILDNLFFETVPPRFADLTDEQQKEFERQIGQQVVSLCEAAWHCEEEENWSEAIRLYHTALLAGGPDAGISFQLAELLEGQGDYAAARERYYNVLELDENHVEARANLGRVLARLGDDEEALAAFEGTLVIHPEYLDVRYEMGKLLFRLGKESLAREQLLYCRRIVPDGPKADEIDSILRSLDSSRDGKSATS